MNAATPAERPRTERIPLGIAYMIGATVMFASSSAVSKWLVERYPVGEVLFMRTLVSLAIVAAIILPFAGLAAFRTRKLPAHMMRGASQGVSQTLIIVAFSLMPLASAVAINFSAPLFATLAAAWFLKERVGAARWMALVVGFGGVLIVTNPGADTFTAGALFALGNAMLYGTVTAGVRGMTSTESTETLMLYQMVFLTVIFAAMLPFGWRTPLDAADLGWMAANGVTNAFGQYWWTRALVLAPASAVGPFYYFMLVWAILLGFLVWGDMPTLTLLLGSAIVVGSGLFLLWHEARKKTAHVG